MINVSNAFKQELFNDRRNYLEYIDITLKDGTVLKLTNKDLWGGGLTIEDAVSKGNSFDVGSAIINKCKVVISNIYDEFSEYDFGDANVVVYVGLNLPDGTTERIRKGTYTVDEAAYNGSIITLQCFDHMQKFDRPYTDSKLTYPATLNQIIRDACSVCGVVLQTYNFPHDTFIVQTRPDDEAITFREIISWCAQIACCFCRCDTLGRLELKWYNQKILEETALDGGDFGVYDLGDKVDGGDFRTWNHENVISGGEFGDRRGMHLIYSVYSLDIATDDVVITGAKVLEKNKEENQDAITTYQSGTDGYVVSVENNELIKGGAGQNISGWIGEQLIGFRFRKASITHASDPTIEAGDVGYLNDRKGNIYRIIVSSTNFSTGNSQNTVSSAQNPARNSAARFSAETKNYVEFRKDIEKERTDREKAQDELKNRIDNSSGLYTTEIAQTDGGTIFYMHDKPILAESMIVWKMTAEAWGVSTDGGKTYNAGMTVDGDTIVRILTATGINADWIKTGAFQITKNGKTMVLMDTKTGQVILRPDVFELSSGKTIDSIAQEKADTALEDAKSYADTAASNAVDGQTQEEIFDKLTNDKAEKAIFLDENGHLFINADFINSGILAGLTVVSKGFGYVGSSGVSLYTKMEGGRYWFGYGGTNAGFTEGRYNANIANFGNGMRFIAPLSDESNASITEYSPRFAFFFNPEKNSNTVYSVLSVEPCRYPVGSSGKRGKSYSTTILKGNLVIDPLTAINDSGASTLTDEAKYGIGWAKNAHSSSVSPRYGIYPVVEHKGFSNAAVVGTGVQGPLKCSDIQTSALSADGYARRVVETDNYSTISQYCYELASPYFGDIGSGITDENGECLVSIDDKFTETCAEVPYYVFLQKEAEGDLWVAEKENNYFVVKGIKNCPFSWEIKQKQKGFENERLDSVDSHLEMEVQPMDIDEIYQDELLHVEDFYEQQYYSQSD